MDTKHVHSVVYALREITQGATIAPKRNAADFYADRLRVATTAGNLLATLNRFGELLGSPVLSGETVAQVMTASASDGADALYRWLVEQPKTAIALCYVKSGDLPNVIAAFAEAYQPRASQPVAMPKRREFDINITVTLEEPLSHGDDKKAGNSTLFRRGMVRGGAELPYYAANAWVGQMRDLFAAHFLTTLGFDIRQPHQLQVWFYHLLYSGGVMADGAIPKSFERALAGAASGSLNVSGTVRLRNMLPFFSLLGGVGKYPLDSRIYVNDLRPMCREWGTGREPLADLMDWRYLTRRDDFEGRVSAAQIGDDDVAVSTDAANTSMIVNVEVLVEGTQLEGGIDLSRHMTEMEGAALARGLEMMATYGYLGGKRRRGFGRCRIEYEYRKPLPDAKLYDQYLADNREAILDYLREIGALVE